VILTDGAGSHPNSSAYPPCRLRRLRATETLAAVACLGLAPEHVVFLKTPDTRAPSDGVGLTELASRIAGLIRVHGCHTILATWAADPHCDHVAAHRIARAAALATNAVHRAYPVWGLTLPPDSLVEGPPTGMRLDISAHLPAKRRAIHCHASQYGGMIDDDPDGFQMAPGFMALFDVPTEIYLDVPS
jgi:LmbE family N-acetylglucosaminyl deacetylase